MFCCYIYFILIRIRILDGSKSEIFRDRDPSQILPRGGAHKSNIPVAPVKYDSRGKDSLTKNVDFFDEEVHSPFGHLFSPHQSLLSPLPSSNPAVQYNTFPLPLPLSLSLPPSSLTPRSVSPATPVVFKAQSPVPPYLPSTFSLPCPILPSSLSSHSPSSSSSSSTSSPPLLPPPPPPPSLPSSLAPALPPLFPHSSPLSSSVSPPTQPPPTNPLHPTPLTPPTKSNVGPH